jgi:hypothetical protein
MTVDVEAKSKSDEAQIHQKVSSPHHEIHCRVCNNSLSRISRGALVKTFLSWLPLKRYVCYRCQRKTYRWSSNRKSK